MHLKCKLLHAFFHMYRAQEYHILCNAQNIIHFYTLLVKNLYLGLLM